MYRRTMGIGTGSWVVIIYKIR